MLESLEGIGFDRVINAYSGRRGASGCTCGCQGKWHDTRSQKTRILNKLRNAHLGGDPRVHVEPNTLYKGVTVVSAIFGRREYILHVK